MKFLAQAISHMPWYRALPLAAADTAVAAVIVNACLAGMVNSIEQGATNNSSLGITTSLSLAIHNRLT
jgi:hypothetical protein